MTVRDGVTVPLAIERLMDAIVAALEAAGAPAPASVGLALSDDVELAALDAAHMGVEGPTDVLSFPLLPPEAYPPHPGKGGAGPRSGDGRPAVPFVLPPARRPHLGDVVVSVERARAQAAEGRGGQTSDVRWSVADEIRLLVVHGTLHLCGWDHAEPVEERAMRALERRILGDEGGPAPEGEAGQVAAATSSGGPKR